MNEMASSDNRGGEELGHQRRVEQGDLSDSSYYVDLILQELSKPISQDHSPGNRDEQRPSSTLPTKTVRRKQPWTGYKGLFPYGNANSSLFHEN
ncbi:hypothetical protein PSTT_10501 [Puccinia striiformis]|uniref:Uncharacterized protein n=1 Tax=Puccinia striiformis TaxID=27350 RepID=A0A2S4V422_9BASI|nr:hypothetical protein PSTT_10501 [Puccinia striiformis]